MGLPRPGPQRSPEQTRHALHRRPSNLTTSLSERRGQRARLSVRPRRPLLKAPRPCEAPEALRPAPRPPEYGRPASRPHLTPASQNTSSQLEPRTPTRAAGAGHVRRAQGAPRPGGGAGCSAAGPERRPPGALWRSRLPFLPGSLPPPPLPSPPGLFPPSLPAGPPAFPVGPGGARALGGSGRGTAVTPFPGILGW